MTLRGVRSYAMLELMKKAAKKATHAERKRTPNRGVALEPIRKLTKDRTEPIPTLIVFPKPSESEVTRVLATIGRRPPANHS